MANNKTLGQAIDEIVAALSALDEGSRLTAVRAACEHVGLSELNVAARRSAETPDDTSKLPLLTPAAAPPKPTALETPSASIHDIRSFKEQKQPGSAIEMACVVAYYLDTLADPAERKKDINTSDLEKYFKQASFRLPKRIAQVLVDAKSGGYFDSAGHGKYKLNPVGYNLVVHGLPKASSK